MNIGLLEELQYEVVNLGACFPIESLVQSIHHHKPDMVLVSTLNGHGHIEGMEIIKRIKQNALLKHVTMVIGGNLGTKGSENGKYALKLKRAGYSAVFAGKYSVQSFQAFMDDMQSALVYKKAS